MTIRKVNLAETFGRFRDHWKPKIVGEVNDSLVKLVKFQGEFVWHHHDHEDELFLVLNGRMRMQLRDGDIVVSKLIARRAVEHYDVLGAPGR